MESFVRPGEAARSAPSPFIPVDVELAKRYVAEGKHHFAVGNLDQAGECFRRALDAAPGHPQLVGFLRRVGELKARLAHSAAPAPTVASAAASVRPTPSAPTSPPQLRVLPGRQLSDVAATPPGARVITLRRPPALSVVPATATVTTQATGAAPASAIVGDCPSGSPTPAKPVALAAQASDARPRVVAAAGSLRADPDADVPTAASGRTSSALAERRTGARVLVADRPLSPALLMDRATGLDAWNETVAGVMVVAGLLVFGWILMFW